MDFGFLDFQTICAIIFVLLMSIFLIIKRKELKTEKIIFPIFYIVMYRTKIGLKSMNRMAKAKRLIRFLGYAAIVVGFIGMAVIVYFLVQSLIHLITVPTAKSSVSLVLPFKVKGAFFVPFFYWIICIFIIAGIHEFAHGVVARRYAMKIKSSGLAFMAILAPVIPAAFVEPDEEQMRKKPKAQQLSVFAAGPFANILLALFVLIITALIMSPILGSMIENKGVVVSGLIENKNAPYPAEIAGIGSGEAILKVNDVEIKTLLNFTDSLQNKSPGDRVIITTNVSSYPVVLASNPDDKTKPYLGIYVSESTSVRPEFEARYTKYSAPVITWFAGLFYWLFVLSLGIGLFNLVPLGPVDGGRMLQTFFESVFKDKKGKEDKKKALLWWKVISIFFLVLVLANLAFAFFR